jgi:DNA-binding MarR family transcriptional regulator
MKRAMMRTRDQLLGELQLTRTQIEVIFFLSEDENQTIGDIAERLAVTHSAATQTVEALVKRGFIARAPDPDDRRIVRIALNPAGNALAKQLHQGRKARMQAVFAGLTEEQLELMITVLNQVNRQLDTTNQTEKMHD